LLFYETEIYSKRVLKDVFDLRDPHSERDYPYLGTPKEHWNEIGNVFVLRNAIVHSDALLNEQIEIGREKFVASEVAILTPATLGRANLLLGSILYPFSPEPL
jgi:hypothetical protein